MSRAVPLFSVKSTVLDRHPRLRDFDQRFAIEASRSDDGETENHFRERRRPKYLSSGLTKCACCGGGYVGENCSETNFVSWPPAADTVEETIDRRLRRGSRDVPDFWVLAMPDIRDR